VGSGKVTDDFITLVTGMPRSGTTLMMRMLEAGGVPGYYDNWRPLVQDCGNTKYVDYNRLLRESCHVRDLSLGETAWFGDCVGKAVKVLNPALVPVPARWPIRAIWCSRPAKDVVKSLYKWYDAVGRPKTPGVAMPAQVERSTRQGKKLLKKRDNVRLVTIAFEDMINRPQMVATTVARFLDQDLDIEAMAAVPVKRSTAVAPHMMEEEIYTTGQQAAAG
jgi:hypothetical protein